MQIPVRALYLLSSLRNRSTEREGKGPDSVKEEDFASSFGRSPPEHSNSTCSIAFAHSACGQRSAGRPRPYRVYFCSHVTAPAKLSQVSSLVPTLETSGCAFKSSGLSKCK